MCPFAPVGGGAGGCRRQQQHGAPQGGAGPHPDIRDVECKLESSTGCREKQRRERAARGSTSAAHSRGEHAGSAGGCGAQRHRRSSTLALALLPVLDGAARPPCCCAQVQLQDWCGWQPGRPPDAFAADRGAADTLAAAGRRPAGRRTLLGRSRQLAARRGATPAAKWEHRQRAKLARAVPLAQRPAAQRDHPGSRLQPTP